MVTQSFRCLIHPMGYSQNNEDAASIFRVLRVDKVITPVSGAIHA